MDKASIHCTDTFRASNFYVVMFIMVDHVIYQWHHSVNCQVCYYTEKQSLALHLQHSCELYSIQIRGHTFLWNTTERQVICGLKYRKKKKK
jgi:hypothetical protein